MLRNLELFYLQDCPYCARVRNYISAHGLESVVRSHEIDEEPGALERLIALTGATQVPCLVADGEPILESKDIVEWLDTNFSKRNPTAA